MGGRSVETTNAWNPAELSVAQMGYEAKAQDIYRDYRVPPVHLSYGNKAERRRIHRHVYGDSWWVDLDGIEAEAAEILESDPANAERFFGNRVVAGSDTWLPRGLWEDAHAWRSGCLSPALGPRSAWASTAPTSTTGRRSAARPETASSFTPRFAGQPTIWNPAEHPDHRVPRAIVARPSPSCSTGSRSLGCTATLPGGSRRSRPGRSCTARSA
jgi:hypothetical protein